MRAARQDEARLPASGSGSGSLLLLVEMLNNEEEDRRTAQGGAARQIRRFPNRTETRGSNNQTPSPEEPELMMFRARASGAGPTRTPRGPNPPPSAALWLRAMRAHENP